MDAASPWSGSGRPGTRGALRRLAGPRRLAGLWWLAVLSSLAWLVLAAIVLRLSSTTTALVLLTAVFLLSVSDEFLARAGCGLPPQRKLAGHAQAAALALLLTVLLGALRGDLSPAADIFAFLLAVIAVALIGGIVPALTEAVAGSLLLGLFTVPRAGQPASFGARDAAVLGVLAGLAVAAGFLAEDTARRSQEAARATEASRAIAKADRMRTALLAAVSHDLRSPLAAAKAAVSCLRAPGIQLTAADHDELLATTDESLVQLERLAASLLDVSRLQAGALPVFSRPADLGEIIVSSLGALGPSARAIGIEVPCHLPEVMADPALTERIIVNLVGNALRYAPAGSPLRLTAGALGDRVELRIIDRGPGIPEADRDQAFLPFWRLGSPGQTVGVGLGLAVSRSLAEGMGGTLRPEETPGGGLTMALSLPAAAAP